MYRAPPSAAVLLRGSRVMTLFPTRFARTSCESPAPDGPGVVRERARFAVTSSGNPDCQLMMGYRLQPFVMAFGTLENASANGRSQPPENTILCFTSRSDTA